MAEELGDGSNLIYATTTQRLRLFLGGKMTTVDGDDGFAFEVERKCVLLYVHIREILERVRCTYVEHRR